MQLRTKTICLARVRIQKGSALTRQISVATVQLDASVAPEPKPGEPDTVNTPVWVQIAAEGTYNGYAGGGFKLTAQTFNEVVANFRRHPSYKAGPDGMGNRDVVPWDFHHASEYGATEGTIPQAGAPAQGWVQELDTRFGTDGKAQLWALTRWLEPARSYVKNGQYKWASVTMVFHSIDPISGQDIGTTLTSVALTNQPFIEGMNPLAASKQGAASKQIRAGAYCGDYYATPATDAADAFAKMRELFGLPTTAGVPECLRQCMLVQEWITMGNGPLGVDLAAIVGAMRVIFNLPALSSNEEVFAECQNLLGRLLEDEAANDDGTMPPLEPTTPPAAPPAGEPMPMAATAATMRTSTMTPEQIRKLAARLGVQPTAEAVLEAMNARLDFHAKIAAALKLSNDVADRVMLDAATESVSARDKLAALLKGLGVQDYEQSITKIGDMFKQVADLEKVMPELKELRDFKEKKTDEEVTEDVDAAIASQGFNKNLRDALVLEHKKIGRVKFLEKYPAKPAQGTPPNNGAPITTALATTSLGGERRVIQNPDGTITLSAPGRAEPNGGSEPPIEINLTGVAGRNKYERVCNHVKASNPKLPWDDITARASALMRAKNVKIIDAAS